MHRHALHRVQNRAPRRFDNHVGFYLSSARVSRNEATARFKTPISPMSDVFLQMSQKVLFTACGLALALQTIVLPQVLHVTASADQAQRRKSAESGEINSTQDALAQHGETARQVADQQRGRDKWLLAQKVDVRSDAKLDESLKAFEGETLDLVVLGTGKRYVRPTLERIISRNGKVNALRLKPQGETRGKTVYLKGIVKINAGRETVYESTVERATAAQLRGKRARELYEKKIEESQDRMRKRDITWWPRLSAEEHAAEVEQLQKFVAEVRTAFPALETTQTHEFIVATDIPSRQIGQYVKSLDKMHDMLCDLYGIPRGEPLWKGKCLVVAFLRQEDFHAFEARFMKADLRGAHGVCHQRSDGRVVMACYRGDDALAFAHMLVHETSHGFNHRWISPARLPSWLNEGIAEWIGTKIVPQCKQVPLKQAHAVEFMKANRTLGSDFFADGPHDKIEAIQYGMASLLVMFLEKRDRKKFAHFVRGIKEGQSVEESLRDAYNESLDELVSNFGQFIRVPLRR